MSHKPLRCGILGCGSFAHVHARILTSLPEAIELVAFCDRNEPRARAYAEQYTAGKAAVYTDHRKMFSLGRLDLALICLPPYGHSDEIALAADAGVHVLVEKPIALTSEHAWRMVEDAEKAQIKTQVGFMFRFGEAIERAKTLLDSGDVGKAGLMAARYFCNSLHSPWWRMREKSGGQMVEQIIHLVDLMRYLMGEATAVYGRQENLFHREIPDYTIEDVSATIFSFQNGGLGVIYASNSAIPNRWVSDYHLVAHRLTVDFEDANRAIFYRTDRPELPPETVVSERDVYREEWLDLLQAIDTDGKTRIPLREGAKSLDLALAATRSAQERCEILLGG